MLDLNRAVKAKSGKPMRKDWNPTLSTGFECEPSTVSGLGNGRQPALGSELNPISLLLVTEISTLSRPGQEKVSVQEAMVLRMTMAVRCPVCCLPQYATCLLMTFVYINRNLRKTHVFCL